LKGGLTITSPLRDTAIRNNYHPRTGAAAREDETTFIMMECKSYAFALLKENKFIEVQPQS
jgi:hypothetical protein